METFDAVQPFFNCNSSLLFTVGTSQNLAAFIFQRFLGIFQAVWCLWAVSQIFLDKERQKDAFRMGPKKIQVMEDLDNIRKITGMDFLSEEVSAFRLQQKSILDLIEELKSLKLPNAEKDKGISFLEN